MTITIDGMLNMSSIDCKGFFTHPYIYKKKGGGLVTNAVVDDERNISFPRNYQKLARVNKLKKVKIIDKRVIAPLISKVKLNEEFSLRTYQEQPVKDIVKALKNKNKLNSCILEAGTGFGKTYILPKIVQELNQRVLILVDRSLLAKQMYEEFTNNTEGNVTMINSKNLKLTDVNIATFQMFAKNPELIDKIKGKVGFLILDECFDGGTEILTENGWVKFSKLKEGVQVLEVDPNTEEGGFVLPSRLIKKKGILMTKEGEGKTIVATEGHRQIFKTPTGTLKTKAFKDMPKNFKIPVKVNFVSDYNQPLTDLERLHIAFQADGSFVKSSGGICGVDFHFKKYRKIKRLLKLLKTCGIEYKSRQNSAGKGRYRVYISSKSYVGFSKKLADVFEMSNFSKEKAQQFLEEVKLWDGYFKDPRPNSIYYSSKESENASFVCAITALAGYYARQTVQVDNRKESYSDIHRVYIDKSREYLSSQNMVSTLDTKESDVYCVTVPKGYIYVRQNGVPFISGNCHVSPAATFGKVISKFPAKYRLGLSATPTRSDGLTEMITDTFGNTKVIGDNPNKLTVNFVGVITDTSMMCSGKKDFAEKFQEAMTSKPILDLVGMSVKAFFKKKRKIMVYSNFEKIQKATKDTMVAQGLRVEIINSKVSHKERDKIIKDFNEGRLDGLVSGVIMEKGISIHSLDTIISLATHNKESLTQLPGRLRREYKGKQKPLYVDFGLLGSALQATIDRFDELEGKEADGDKFFRYDLNKYKQMLRKI